MNCESCGKRLKPIGIIQGEKFYYECDTCYATVCEKCCDVDDEGNCECVDCIQTKIVRKYHTEEVKKCGL